MDREALEKRILELKEMLRRLENNGNAIGGAIQECEHWLAVISKPADEAE